ncbi:gamma-glutamylcyclotransferase family protein [Methylophilus aquaticus]|uniref:Gamma-glutamylcyclotransferase family protein n=1 Tax=Methylophilus aquaticus TaxID=1971610 RepID=A0ABT9JST4_9PROT|nr:gamma-glutamylcyclotransferase family protein [Methylophilus aquaticus]MDP8567589.1 gamma-glutamylcyclotransferase family protein [Methylophilus aquaticus]
MAAEACEAAADVALARIIMSDLLFVYGTLRKGNANKMSAYLSTHAQFLTHAWFQGLMFQISYYPGVIASEDVNDCVYGEVYKLNDPDSALAILDAYEECSAQHTQPAEYKRVIARIHAKDGTLFEQVWIYLYQWPINDKVLIKEGDFMKGLGLCELKTMGA